MIRRPALTIAATTILLIGFIPWYLHSSVEPRENISKLSYQPTSESDRLIRKKSITTSIENELTKSTNEAPDPFNTQLAKELITQYGDKIAHLAVQANLFKVREFVISRYPEDGHSRFNSIINLAFPDHAESIIKLIELMSQYSQWLTENYTALNDMSPLERDGHLWEKRRALFGQDADIIWSDERALLAQRQRNVQQEIHRLGLDSDLTTDEKLYQLKTTLSENYGESTQDLVIDPGMVAAVFFNFESVQKTLQSLPSQERQAEINNVRKQLGYNDTQVEQAQQKDEERNERWTKGLAYMVERQNIADTLEGAELEAALAALRNTHFGREAYTIEQEEKSGFYRYARPRIYGRN